LEKSIIHLINQLGSFSSLLPVFAYFAISNNRRIWQLLVIFFYCIISLTTDRLIGSSFVKDNHNAEYLILTIFTIIELALFSYFIVSCLSMTKLRRTIIALNACFITFTIISYLGGAKNDSLFASVECILVIIFCIFYFYEQLVSPTEVFLYSSYSFWVIVGFFLYLSGTLFLFIYAVSLPRNESVNFWYINGIFSLLKNICFTIAFLLKKPSPNIITRKKYNIP
jgi:hypothetical protein